MPLSSVMRDRLNRFFLNAYSLAFDALPVDCVSESGLETQIFFQYVDKRCPEMVSISPALNGRHPKIIPWHRIHERPNRQIVSYLVGKNISNLAEVREISGRLYSRYAPTYETDELPHQHPDQSVIALWLHDCLTEDFDHQHCLNRTYLQGGACISYDFGMAFTHPYFPPFYTFELNIGDSAILRERHFVMTLLTRYASAVKVPEETFISQLSRLYPATGRPDLCRYYFRNFKTRFFRRVRLSQCFEKLRQAPFLQKEIQSLLEVLAVDGSGIGSWEELMRQWDTIPSKRLELRGLDFSGADLRRARLRNADLREVNFQGADLSRADLRGADIRGADFRNAVISGIKINPTALNEAVV